MRFWKRNRHRAKGDAARDKRDWPAAARAYERHLSHNPGDAAIWIQLGHACKECERLSAAQIAYQRALFLRPHDADLFVQMGHLHRRFGDPAAALSAYRRALELDPALGSAREAISTLEITDAAENGGVLARMERALKTLSGRVGLIEQAIREGRLPAAPAAAGRPRQAGGDALASSDRVLDRP